MPPAKFTADENRLVELAVVEKRLVVVALVVVARVIIKSVAVEDAVERNPLSNANVVEVACSLVLNLVKAQGSPAAADGQVVLQVSPVKQILVEAKLVVVAEVVVELVARKLVRVEEAVERNPFKKARVVEVASSLVESFNQGKEKVIEDK